MVMDARLNSTAPITLDDLNPEQRAAALALDGPLLIVAGAGSGKTRVLTHRIAYLLAERKAAPEQILAVTFTNKAANEMRERVARLVGDGLVPRWIGTFHSICARILRQEAALVGYRANFAVFDESDALSVAREVVAAANLGHSPTPEVAYAQIEQAKNEALWPADLARAARTPKQLAIAEIYRLYQERMQSLNALDFGDLLLLAFKLFANHPEALKRWQERFQYILVDEYQDTNRVQYCLVRALARASLNLCVVGDEDQSIYRWRGADIRNILDFERDFPDAAILKLEQNYRSTKTILAAAQALICNNRDRKPKELWTANEAGEPISCYTGFSERDEAEFIVCEIQRLAAAGRARLNEMVVFYRVNAQSRPLEEALVRRRVPYHLVGGVRFYERREIKDLIAYLRVLANPADELSLERALGVPPRGIGARTIEALKAHARRRSISLFDALGQAEAVSEIGLRIGKKATAFHQWMRALSERVGAMAVREVLEDVLSATEFLVYLEGSADAGARRENVGELLSAAAAFDAVHGAGTLVQFLESVALLSEADEAGKWDGVSLMTLHTSKGLEYPVVFIAGMEEGLFPHSRSQDTEAELEEERRLLYVGMTRAQKLLYLTNARSREIYGLRQEARPSRFLSEIDPALIRHCGALSPRASAPAPTSSTYVDYGDGDPVFEESFAETDNEAVIKPLRVGSRVVHPNFGTGRIRRIEGRGEATKAWVDFERAGIKLLALKYARLRPIA
jgi:DNA helicase-2/ATP-dependent DNA helicase PcrA